MAHSIPSHARAVIIGGGVAVKTNKDDFIRRCRFGKARNGDGEIVGTRYQAKTSISRFMTLTLSRLRRSFPKAILQTRLTMII